MRSNILTYEEVAIIATALKMLEQYKDNEQIKAAGNSAKEKTIKRQIIDIKNLENKIAQNLL